mmetsp:Transcript_332/g.829  ORF Transcript_332/g.829 Transcript_332/m.829 type:complete len:325 (+) Transcript_332:758-1732(+)
MYANSKSGMPSSFLSSDSTVRVKGDSRPGVARKGRRRYGVSSGSRSTSVTIFRAKRGSTRCTTSSLERSSSRCRLRSSPSLPRSTSRPSAFVYWPGAPGAPSTFFGRSGTVSVSTTRAGLVPGGTRSRHCRLCTHDAKAIEPPACASSQLERTVKRVQRSSAMRTNHTRLKYSQKSSYSIQNEPSSVSLEYESIWRRLFVQCSESSDHLPRHSESPRNVRILISLPADRTSFATSRLYGWSRVIPSISLCGSSGADGSGRPVYSAPIAWFVYTFSISRFHSALGDAPPGMSSRPDADVRSTGSSATPPQSSSRPYSTSCCPILW